MIRNVFRRLAMLAITVVSIHLGGAICRADIASPGAGMIVIAKSWLIGYALVFLGILLGLLAVLIPSMRKTVHRKDG